jgi:hypothetical protein
MTQSVFCFLRSFRSYKTAVFSQKAMVLGYAHPSSIIIPFRVIKTNFLLAPPTAAEEDILSEKLFF